MGPLACTCAVLACPSTKQAVVVDPGDDAERILEVVRSNGLTVVAALVTHGHVDHFAAAAPVKAATGCQVHLHASDLPLYRAFQWQASALGIVCPSVPAVDGALVEGQRVGFGGAAVTVLHTPGHTPGSVCLHGHDGDGEVLFSGDTLFRRGVGRTDLPGGDPAALRRSLLERLAVLPPDLRVIPGHGPATTIGDELPAR